MAVRRNLYAEQSIVSILRLRGALPPEPPPLGRKNSREIRTPPSPPFAPRPSRQHFCTDVSTPTFLLCTQFLRAAIHTQVEYANDLNISDFWSGFPMPPKNFMDGSSFDRSKPCAFDDPEYYRTCGWNLNNLPFWPGSVLRFFRTHINGLTAPW